MSPAPTLARLAAACRASLTALADADAAIVRACARGNATPVPWSAPDIRTRAGLALRQLGRGWADAIDTLPDDVTPLDCGITLPGQVFLAPAAYADALDAGAGIGHAAAYADGLRAWWAEAERCFAEPEGCEMTVDGRERGSAEERTMSKATKVRDLDGWKGSAALYRCEAGGPLPEYVVVSAVRDALVHETYIFAADAEGVVTDWGELSGSLKDTTDHVEALANAGYGVAPAFADHASPSKHGRGICPLHGDGTGPTVPEARRDGRPCLRLATCPPTSPPAPWTPLPESPYAFPGRAASTEPEVVGGWENAGGIAARVTAYTPNEHPVLTDRERVCADAGAYNGAREARRQDAAALRAILDSAPTERNREALRALLARMEGGAP